MRRTVAKHLIPRGTLLVLAALSILAARPVWAQVDPGSTNGGGADRIYPGDVVRLSVLRDSSLSGDFPVNQYGTVVLPLIGEVEVTRLTHRALRDQVVSGLREVRVGPDIEVVVLRRVRVVGEVNEPGVYNLDPTMTVADAVAMARGGTALAQEGRVLLHRDGQVRVVDLTEDMAVALSPVRSGDEIRVPRRGWIARNVGTVIGAVTATLGIVVTLVVSK